MAGTCTAGGVLLCAIAAWLFSRGLAEVQMDVTECEIVKLFGVEQGGLQHVIITVDCS